MTGMIDEKRFPVVAEHRMQWSVLMLNREPHLLVIVPQERNADKIHCTALIPWSQMVHPLPTQLAESYPGMTSEGVVLVRVYKDQYQDQVQDQAGLILDLLLEKNNTDSFVWLYSQHDAQYQGFLEQVLLLSICEDTLCLPHNTV
jgi:hypothetical protein